MTLINDESHILSMIWSDCARWSQVKLFGKSRIGPSLARELPLNFFGVLRVKRGASVPTVGDAPKDSVGASTETIYSTKSKIFKYELFAHPNPYMRLSLHRYSSRGEDAFGPLCGPTLLRIAVWSCARNTVSSDAMLSMMHKGSLCVLDRPAQGGCILCRLLSIFCVI